MKQGQNINLKLPIFSWLFFLFLSSGISYYHSNLQFGKPVLVERVDQIISNFGKRDCVVKFSSLSEKSSLLRSLHSQYLQIKQLSKKLDRTVHLALSKQCSLFESISYNTILHFRSHNLASNSSDDFPDFLS